MKKGFTLLELMIVVIIIGILASLAVPQYLTSVEKARIGKAKNAMVLVSQAEKMYRAEKDTYLAVLNANLNNLSSAVPPGLGSYVELDQVSNDTDWDYAVAARTVIDDDFRVTATRAAAAPTAYASKTLTLDDDGTWNAGVDNPHPLR